MKLLLDEMLSATVADQLRLHGHDVVAVHERPDLRGSADPELFEHAQAQGRVVVTYNREDFLALDRAYRSAAREHHGLVILHPRRFPQGQASIGPLVASLDAFMASGAPYPGFVHWLQ